MSTNIDTNYCFMDDVVEGFAFRPEYFINAQNVNDRKMGDGSGKVIPYEDPDALSLKLYESLQAIWGRVLGLEEIVWDEDYSCYYFSNKSDGMRYSSDYIGPSATRAFQLGVDDLTVGSAIKECRTIGGHMIWPRHTANVNTSRGKAVCDRIDITLMEIKDFYERNFSEKAFLSQEIRNALVKDKEWFKNFIDFVGFSNSFLLVGSFVDARNYQVVKLAEINPENAFIPETEEKYRRFIQENINAVKRRNEWFAKFSAEELDRLLKSDKELRQSQKRRETDPEFRTQYEEEMRKMEESFLDIPEEYGV